METAVYELIFSPLHPGSSKGKLFFFNQSVVYSLRLGSSLYIYPPCIIVFRRREYKNGCFPLLPLPSFYKFLFVCLCPCLCVTFFIFWFCRVNFGMSYYWKLLHLRRSPCPSLCVQLDARNRSNTTLKILSARLLCWMSVICSPPFVIVMNLGDFVLCSPAGYCHNRCDNHSILLFSNFLSLYWMD